MFLQLILRWAFSIYKHFLAKVDVTGEFITSIHRACLTAAKLLLGIKYHFVSVSW